MLRFALKNIKLLSILNKIPIIKYFFVLHLSKIHEVVNESLLALTYRFLVITEGTSKQTSQNRFYEVDLKIINMLKAQNSKSIIHDIGVSNGITSVELSKKMSESNIEADFTISDKYSKVYLTEGFISRIYDANQNMMFAYVGIIVASPHLRYFYISQLMFKLINKQTPIKNCKTIYLFHHKVFELIDNGVIKYLEYDVFSTKLSEVFTFVRCMNVLNLNYFGEAAIKQAIENISSSLVDRGILLIGRTLQDGTNHATFFTKLKQKLIPVSDVNSGSEIKYIVEQIFNC